MKPYPNIEDSGTTHAEDWFEHQHMSVCEKPPYREGLILRPKVPITGYATIYKVDEDGIHVVTDFGNTVTFLEKEVDSSYEVMAECGDGVTNHIKHQINKLTEFLEEYCSE